MKAQILKISGHKNEKDFYKEFPTMESFMSKHGTAFKKAQNGFQVDRNNDGVNDSLHDYQIQNNFIEQPLPQNFSGKQVPMGKNGGKLKKIAQYGSTIPKYSFSTNSNDVDFGGLSYASQSDGDFMNTGMSLVGDKPGSTEAARLNTDQGGSDNTGAYIQAAISTAQGVAEGSKSLKKERRLARRLGALAKASDVVNKSYFTKDVDDHNQMYDAIRRQREALMPVVNGNEYFSDFGVGTNSLALAKHGGEITNTYAPNTLYTNLGYEPVVSPNNVKGYKSGGKLVSAQYGNSFLGEQDNKNTSSASWVTAANTANAISSNTGQGPDAGSGIGGSIGSGIGTVVGTYFGGPLLGSALGAVGKWAGSAIGGSLDKNDKKMKQYTARIKGNAETISRMEALKGKYSAHRKHGGTFDNSLRTGGNIRQNSVGDVTAVSGGYLEPISYNPHTGGTGITSMIEGQSHDESNGVHSGVILDFKGNQVEAERGEPISQRQDGGSLGESSVIAGDQTFGKFGAELLPHLSKYKDKKIKNIQKEIAEKDAKLNKFESKNILNLNNFSSRTPIDKLTENSYIKNDEGIQQKYKINAKEVDDLIAYQEAVNKTAKIMGANAGDLSRGKIKYESQDRIAQSGKTIAPNKPKFLDIANSFIDNSKSSKKEEMEEEETQDKKPKFDVTPYLNSSLETVAGQILPWIRETPEEDLQFEQIAGELSSLGETPEPVQARFYNPNLKNPYTVSYQDQLNENQADFNQLVKLSGSNPQALAALAAQKYSANSKILSEEFRANQAIKNEIYNQNRDTLNDAQLKNLSIADQQYTRQTQANANTKAIKRAAMDSIASKTLQNRLENRMLKVGSNEFKDFTFDSSGRLVRTGAPTTFNIPQNYIPVYDNDGNLKSYYEKEKASTKTTRNGGIVKAFKNL